MRCNNVETLRNFDAARNSKQMEYKIYSKIYDMTAALAVKKMNVKRRTCITLRLIIEALFLAQNPYYNAIDSFVHL